MVDVVVCDSLPIVRTRTYRGMTGPKICVQYRGGYYILKSRQRLYDKGFSNVTLHYANDPISEYVGSHIYEIVGIPVHETILGTYNDRLCVLCKDLAYPKQIVELRDVRNIIMSEEVTQSNDGMSSSISDIMQIIDECNAIDYKESTRQRFYQMLVVDALIGNTDRNNSNWGFLATDNDTLELCPVYDCGGCLNNKASDEQLSEYINDEEKMRQLALEYTVHLKDVHDNEINPFHYIEHNLDNPFILRSLALVKDVDENKIFDLIDSLDNICTSDRRWYYKRILSMRLAKLRSLADSNKSLKGLFQKAEG